MENAELEVIRHMIRTDDTRRELESILSSLRSMDPAIAESAIPLIAALDLRKLSTAAGICDAVNLCRQLIAVCTDSLLLATHVHLPPFAKLEKRLQWVEMLPSVLNPQNDEMGKKTKLFVGNAQCAFWTLQLDAVSTPDDKRLTLAALRRLAQCTVHFAELYRLIRTMFRDSLAAFKPSPSLLPSALPFKPKLCASHISNECPHPLSCPFAHSLSELSCLNPSSISPVAPVPVPVTPLFASPQRTPVVSQQQPAQVPRFFPQQQQQQQQQEFLYHQKPLSSTPHLPLQHHHQQQQQQQQHHYQQPQPQQQYSQFPQVHTYQQMPFQSSHYHQQQSILHSHQQHQHLQQQPLRHLPQQQQQMYQQQPQQPQQQQYLPQHCAMYNPMMAASPSMPKTPMAMTKGARTQPNQLYKTQICKHWRSGHCKRGDQCCFAHGEFELSFPSYFDPPLDPSFSSIPPL